MDAPTLSPYKFEVDLPESEGSGSEDEETDLASGKKFWYFYIGELQERPKSGTTAVYRFLIPHAVTPPEKQLESRTMSVGITDAAKRSKEGALVIRYCGEGQEDDFAVSFVYHSWSSPSVPVTRLEGGLSWTVTKTLFPLSIYVKVGVPLTVIKPSALRTFMRSGEAGRRSEKVSLLDEAQATGDVSLICKVKTAKQPNNLVARNKTCILSSSW